MGFVRPWATAETRRPLRRNGCSIVALALASASTAVAAQQTESALPAQIWPEISRPAAAAPNVLVIMTDDVGFAASSTFGGPIPTPTFDELAARGLRYNRFHTTAICSATRAALLTGRNHNAVGVGGVTDVPSGRPGYDTVIKKDSVAIPELLRRAGYSTACLGKWHVTPNWEQGPSGPFDRWPTGMGCEMFYGFMSGSTNQWAPALYNGTTPISPPRDPNYILDRDLADRSIQWLREQKATSGNRPFFMYYATGTAHSPHHAPANWIARFKGKFDQGWDVLRQEILARQIAQGVAPAGTKLTPLPPGIAPWETLSPDRKKLYAREMEVFAAALAHADFQIGRVIDELKAEGRFDDTMIVYVQGDNGSSSEGGEFGVTNEVAAYNNVSEDFQSVFSKINDLGGPRVYSHYATGWAIALDTPFKWTKLVASHFGGTRNGMVISWPNMIKYPGQVRSQFSHVTDLYPTILDAAQLRPPLSVDGIKQQPLAGESLLYSFNSAAAPERHRTQYFAIGGDAAIYQDGWVAATTPAILPWDAHRRAKAPPFSTRQWELYDTRNDFSEATDLAAINPAKLKQLKAVFAREAKVNNVEPGIMFTSQDGVPDVRAGVKSFEYGAGAVRISPWAAPPTVNKSFDIDAAIELSGPDAEGVVVTDGGRFGGYALYLERGHVVFTYNLADAKRMTVADPKMIGAGSHQLRLSFFYDGGGAGKGARATLFVDGREAASARIERTTAWRYSIDESFDVGTDTGTAVSDDYETGTTFPGSIKSVKFTIK